MRRPGGGTFLAAVSATPIRGGDGDVVGAVVAAEDMTEIRNAEAEAAASEQRLRLAHEAAELGSWHWDMAAGVTVWDEQLEAIYGMPPGGFDGTFEAWEATVHPDDHDAGDGGRPGGARPPARRTSCATGCPGPTARCGGSRRTARSPPTSRATPPARSAACGTSPTG